MKRNSLKNQEKDFIDHYLDIFKLIDSTMEHLRLNSLDTEKSQTLIMDLQKSVDILDIQISANNILKIVAWNHISIAFNLKTLSFLRDYCTKLISDLEKDSNIGDCEFF